MKILRLTALCVLSSLICHLEGGERPNIIFLFADDQNFSSVGIYGNPEVETPHMDQLGRDGLIFDNHYNTTAICMASRANVFTGMYEYKTGTNFSHGHMKGDIWEKSYPKLLREAGYLTAFAGKFGLEVENPDGTKDMPAEDFDFWGGAPGQSDYRTAHNESMAAYAEDYPHSTLSYGAFGRDVIRKSVDAGKPFCLSISFKAPHRPTTPDPQFDDVYRGKTFTKPANYGREHGEHLAPQSRLGRQYPRFEEWHYDDEYDRVMATYYQQIYAIDVALGMIREEVEKQGLGEDTVIIYTSDNGFFCGAHGYGSKVLPYEESARVPLMILDPRSASAGRGARTRALTANIDFAPTMLELAGLEVPANMDGSSLLPLLEDPSRSIREQLAFINVFGPYPTRCLSVLTQDHKYIYWWYGDDNMAPTEELFHLAEDPLELTNLASSPEAGERLAEMRQRYDQELLKWKNEAVPHHGYPRYVTLFDRNLPHAEKSFPGKKKN
ncbi:MAG: sulfatase [Verrucomicrobiota bacterium JB023]|nr:sulfatase [Verrucomicrobiota bacterium JB023]